MAVRAITFAETGVTLYARGRRPADDYIWNAASAAWEAEAVANVADYTLQHNVFAVETPAGSYRYQVTIPAWGAGDYELEWYRKVGAAAAIADIYLLTTALGWNGTEVVVCATNVLDASSRVARGHIMVQGDAPFAHEGTFTVGKKTYCIAEVDPELGDYYIDAYGETLANVALLIAAAINANDAANFTAVATTVLYEDYYTVFIQATAAGAIKDEYLVPITTTISALGLHVGGLSGTAPATPPTAEQNGTAAAAAILATPANKIATDETGKVTYANAAPLSAQQTRDAVGLAAANLDAQLAALTSSAGTGAHTVTVTAEDENGDPIEGARVRLTSGVITYVADSDDGGDAVFNLDDGIYAVAATKPGYFFGGATLTVDGNEAVNVEMTAVVIPSQVDPALTTAYGVTRTARGEVAPGVAVTFHLLSPHEAGQFSREPFTATSGADGAYTVALLRLAQYEFARADGPSVWKRFTTTDTETFELPVI
jgi:hypothetical protein